MKHWLPYKLRFLGLKLEKYFGVFKDPKIRVTLVFLRYGSKVNAVLGHRGYGIGHVCSVSICVSGIKFLH